MDCQYFIGVDGGGTKCRARLMNVDGEILAECAAGSANIYSAFDKALETVSRLIADVYLQANLPFESSACTSVVLGLAGANVESYRQCAQEKLQGFAHVKVVSDAEIACVGGHLGESGAVLITGTGSQGVRWDGRQFSRVGGWGFSLADQGSGAILGRRAVRYALQAHEHLIEPTALTREIMSQFDNSPEQMLTWSTNATPADWGQFAPAIFHYAELGDAVATQLVRQTASEIDQMLDYLTHQGKNGATLMGGLAKPILPWLSARNQAVLIDAKGDALDGALILSRLSCEYL
ncbi:BadF/BadG/BcrA/BcrD ATPase family protein [Vibrio ruber]|uniref:BadF/BadG/BcrA/BcrD ATPase family protein n=1 Tax=Vibrio ruber TaxID=184755 RepID=UPI002893431E|nr:BadF/BadG/BcrA/BcrD ATPase family protein [Vibrio ruber]WNJ94195.1 BadF/BadG/BcrA/BcrD ATPase family protein [Vibrio ruber]